jgi:hypothetical protein
MGLNTTPSGMAPALQPAAQAARAVLGAPEWRVPHWVLKYASTRLEPVPVGPIPGRLLLGRGCKEVSYRNRFLILLCHRRLASSREHPVPTDLPARRFPRKNELHDTAVLMTQQY